MSKSTCPLPDSWVFGKCWLFLRAQSPWGGGWVLPDPTKLAGSSPLYSTECGQGWESQTWTTAFILAWPAQGHEWSRKSAEHGREDSAVLAWGWSGRLQLMRDHVKLEVSLSIITPFLSAFLALKGQCSLSICWKEIQGLPCLPPIRAKWQCLLLFTQMTAAVSSTPQCLLSVFQRPGSSGLCSHWCHGFPAKYQVSVGLSCLNLQRERNSQQQVFPLISLSIVSASLYKSSLLLSLIATRPFRQGTSSLPHSQIVVVYFLVSSFPQDWKVGSVPSLFSTTTS